MKLTKKRIATTVKIEESTYDEFKILGVRNHITLQDLMERTISLYTINENFRNILNNYMVPILDADISSSMDIKFICHKSSTTESNIV